MFLINRFLDGQHDGVVEEPIAFFNDVSSVRAFLHKQGDDLPEGMLEHTGAKYYPPRQNIVVEKV